MREFLGYNFYFFDEVDSTNELAKDYSAKTVIVAKKQTSGRGRNNNKWFSPIGGAWFSIVEDGKNPFQIIRKYVLATYFSILSYKIRNLWIKWPNDIYWKNKKIMGMLSFLHGNKLIVGIGINVNNKPPLNTSIALKNLLGKNIKIIELIEKIILNFKKVDSEEYFFYSNLGLSNQKYYKVEGKICYPLKILKNGQLLVKFKREKKPRKLIATDINLFS